MWVVFVFFKHRSFIRSLGAWAWGLCTVLLDCGLLDRCWSCILLVSISSFEGHGIECFCLHWQHWYHYLVVLLPDVGFARVCYIYHNCSLLLFIHKHNVQLKSHHHCIKVDLEVLQDFRLVIHLWWCCPFSPSDLQPILDVYVYTMPSIVYGAPSMLYLPASCNLLLWAGLSQRHICKICSLGVLSGLKDSSVCQSCVNGLHLFFDV